MRAGIACPTCGHANEGDDHICRHCGAYLRPGAQHAGTIAPPARVAPRDDSPGISVALREPDGRYGATSIPELRVDPGGHVELVVRVTNNSPIVERVELSIEGVPDPATWAEFHDDTLDLLPLRRSSSGGHERETLLTVRFP